jgi:hypothetical protein
MVDGDAIFVDTLDLGLNAGVIHWMMPCVQEGFGTGSSERAFNADLVVDE